MSEPVVAPPADGSGTAAPPPPQQQAAEPPAPAAPKPQTPQAVPLNAVELGGTGNSDLEDPDD